jgi:hypothetical protein
MIERCSAISSHPPASHTSCYFEFHVMRAGPEKSKKKLDTKLLWIDFTHNRFTQIDHLTLDAVEHRLAKKQIEQ